MTRYLLRRAAQAILVLWAAFTVSFVILYLLPSDPIAIMLNPGGSGNYVDPVKAAELSAEYGFDKPVIVQYVTLLGNYLRRRPRPIHPRSGAPVTSAIGQAAPQTLQLAGLALALAVVFGSRARPAGRIHRQPVASADPAFAAPAGGLDPVLLGGD